MNADELTEPNSIKIVWESLSPGGRHRFQAYLGYYKAIVDRDYKGLFYFGIYLHGVVKMFRDKIETHLEAQEEVEKSLKEMYSAQILHLITTPIRSSAK